MLLQFGVDAIPDSSDLEVSFQFTNLSPFSQNSPSEGNEPIIDKVKTSSIISGVNLMNAYTGKQLNLSHCKVVVFSEEVAKKGLLPEISGLINNSQIRPTTNIIIAKDSANKYLSSSTSSLEQVLTKYYDIFPHSSEYTGYTADIILGEFYDTLIDKNMGSTAILGTISVKNSSESSSSSGGGSSSSSGGGSSESSSSNSNGSSSGGSSENQESEDKNETTNASTVENIGPGEAIIEGDRGTENIGLCVFKDDSYIGDLSPIETLCYCLIKDNVDNFLVNIDNPFDPNSKISISVEALSGKKISVDINGPYPKIKVTLNLTAKVATGLDKLNYSDTKTLETINNALNNYLTTQVSKYLYKTSREFKSDINQFDKIVKRKFLTIQDFENYNWAEKYENAKFEVDIKCDLVSSILMENS